MRQQIGDAREAVHEVGPEIAPGLPQGPAVRQRVGLRLRALARPGKEGIGRTARAGLGDEPDLVARHLQAPYQHVDDTLDAAIEPRRHLDLGVGGQQEAHQRHPSL